MTACETNMRRKMSLDVYKTKKKHTKTCENISF